MNTDAIREWLTKQPFRPFILNLSNGESHEVRHPENVAIGKTRIAVTWPETDTFVHISLIHINSIEDAPNRSMTERTDGGRKMDDH